MLIDSHCHLDFPQFADDLAGVVSRAADAGVARMVTISTRVRHFGDVVAIAERDPAIYCSVGTHPHNAGEETEITTAELVALSDHPKCIAIGEAGLDFYYDKSPRADQATGFRRHIAAARKTGLPLVIHSRDADDEMASILREESGQGAFPFILHCFSSGPELAREGIELGGYISFSGIVTFKNSEALRDIARSVPLDRILVETDAPYLAPVPHRGRTNEPSYVADTARSLADTIGIPYEEFANKTTENCLRVFSKMPQIFR